MRTLQNFGELTWPQSRQIIISNPSFPDALQGRSRDQFVSTAPPNITVMDNDNVSAYAHQFSAGVSRMVGRNFGVTADVIFVQRKSDRDTVDLNLPDPVTRVRPYPQFARVNYWQPTADNNYTALLLKFETPLQRPLPVPGVLHAEQERGRQLPERLRRSLRLLQGDLSRARPIAAIGSSSAASCSCRGICRSRRSATSDRACR